MKKQRSNLDLLQEPVPQSSQFMDHRGVVYSRSLISGVVQRVGVVVEGEILPLRRMNKKARRRVRKIQKEDVSTSEG